MSTLPPVSRFVSSTGVRIYRIACRVFESLSGRVYLLLGAGPPTLFDAGSGLGPSTDDIRAGLEAIRQDFGEPFRPADLRRIIISHGHSDHIGGLMDFCRSGNVEILVHELDALAIMAHDEHLAVGRSRLREFLLQADVAPARRAELIEVSHFSGRKLAGLEVARNLTDGDEVDGLRIVHTPGHSPGHICLVTGNLLLSADHILARTVPQQWPESIAAYTGLGHYFAALEKIRRIADIEITLPAHELVVHDVYARIRTIKAAHLRRLERLLTVLRKIERPLSIDEISRELYPEVTGFRAVLAITDVGARVEYLHQRGRLHIVNLAELETEDRPVPRFVVE